MWKQTIVYGAAIIYNMQSLKNAILAQFSVFVDNGKNSYDRHLCESLNTTEAEICMNGGIF